MKKTLLLSVCFLCFFIAFSHDFIKFTDGTVIKADGVKIDGSKAFIKIEKGEFEYKTSEIAFISLEGGNIIYYNYDKEKYHVQKSTSIQKGMSVYVYRSESMNIIKKLCALYTIDYFLDGKTFNVVHTPNEAHFIFETVFDNKGKDKIYFLIKDKETNKVLYESKRLTSKGSFNPHWEAEDSVNKLMKRELNKIWEVVNYW